ncbi:hypothetical protein [Campylobacter vulpis]|uniref:hypothetical protein n=1 Tax=Campylobacter vulpis TaxID=1655500 RepID=UPI000C147FD8|nr:hypothetical protein [Campylobacter vulpis]MBS4275602.1 hypothetical protein [Campylobacter vulpis]MBS4306815.1 hypothetical protein [Campylobacter vulpis]MBS4329923.1 hypothetical protein [Campylobacter vulpis]MBS4423570.1 hypothetical protein [Campylobacter vulpis]PHY89913.1 hypothetical protein AA995_07180 [Campylobacter vulpis]
MDAILDFVIISSSLDFFKGLFLGLIVNAYFGLSLFKFLVKENRLINEKMLEKDTYINDKLLKQSNETRDKLLSEAKENINALKAELDQAKKEAKAFKDELIKQQNFDFIGNIFKEK